MPEPRTFKEQDLVTIIVNKSELYVNNSNLQRQRKIEGTMGLTDWVRFPSWKKIPEPILTEPPVIGGEIDHTSRSKGQLNNVEKLEFMITCRVLNKLPNGLLFVEGDDDQTVGEEKKVIHVSGYLSPEAIGEDNTVQSDRLYSRKIRVIPSGNVFDSTKRGYGQRWMERWMPF